MSMNQQSDQARLNEMEKKAELKRQVNDGLYGFVEEETKVSSVATANKRVGYWIPSQKNTQQQYSLASGISSSLPSTLHSSSSTKVETESVPPSTSKLPQEINNIMTDQQQQQSKVIIIETVQYENYVKQMNNGEVIEEEEEKLEKEELEEEELGITNIRTNSL